MNVQYKPKRNLLGTIFQIEILQGMALTLRKLFSPPITRQYPDEMPPMYPGFRGQHALVRDPVTQDSKCIGCMRCATICPSRCIHIRCEKDARGKEVLESYSIETLRCVFCGFCVEVCPVGAITMTEVFEYSSYVRESLYFDKDTLLKNWDRFLEESGHGEDYVNPFWRPRGLPEGEIPAAQRMKVPADWAIEGQFIGTSLRKSQQNIAEMHTEEDHA